jgi:hypothetical protein
MQEVYLRAYAASASRAPRLAGLNFYNTRRPLRASIGRCHRHGDFHFPQIARSCINLVDECANVQWALKGASYDI